MFSRRSKSAVRQISGCVLVALAGASMPAFGNELGSRGVQLAQARPGAAPATAPGGGQPNLLGQYGDWGAYTGGKPGAKVCFALAKPASSQTVPPNRPRDPIYFFLTTRAADNVRNEVSVMIGYTFKPGSEATAEIGTTKFSMYTETDGAWVKDPAEEARFVEALRKGQDLVIKGQSGRGTQTTDRYSLKGLAQAIDRINQECK